MKRSLLVILVAVAFVLGSCENDRKLEMNPQSTAIYRVEYWPESATKRFVVYFTSNPSKGYNFQALEMETWEAWTEAQSAGGFYHTVIRPDPKYKTR